MYLPLTILLHYQSAHLSKKLMFWYQKHHLEFGSGILKKIMNGIKILSSTFLMIKL